MRGKEAAAVFQRTGAGITPAYAGKRELTGNLFIVPRDHPRVCGEKPVRIQTRTISAGSPPRMRGKVVRGMQQALRYRITPAYAGKSQSPDMIDLCMEDHPRVCGEKVFCPFPGWKNGGSPPRMRGKGILSSVATVRTGITPAYAGKSHIPNACVTTTWDHPRVCGEKVRCAAGCGPPRGSPPRMRGKD